ncbi:peroxiredoxin [Nocardioides mesophilus]|uniref:Alkyl hydroperoxide reductase E n=1 Tax=Nocardioides mesophilus TaxID=433659 RepID=A0A7G9RGP3_9ACTN|nr:peroxiredoxin [Nocardioides mesophilus]QNN54768.1 peroxiredoxin [Nocardioides mesophilus]
METGHPAPDFELRDQHGQPVRLSSYRGKAVVLMFYPYAFSRVCTGELHEVREQQPAFESDRVQLLAVSCDPMFTLRAFADRDGLTFPLLSDFWPHGAVAAAYGVFDEVNGCARRSSFVIDRAGVVRWSVHNAMPEARDLAEQLRVLDTLP